MEHWKIERQGQYIVVNILHGSEYEPLLLFANMEYFGVWVKSVADHCHEMVQLSEEIKKVCDSPSGGYASSGVIYDYVNRLEKLDTIGKS